MRTLCLCSDVGSPRKEGSLLSIFPCTVIGIRHDREFLTESQLFYGSLLLHICFRHVTTWVFQPKSDHDHQRHGSLSRKLPRTDNSTVNGWTTSALSQVTAGQKQAAIDVPDLDLPQGSRPMLGLKKGRYRPNEPSSSIPILLRIRS